MTLALHGKSKQRQWLLLAAAFWAVVVGAAVALSVSQRADATHVQPTLVAGNPKCVDDLGYDNEFKPFAGNLGGEEENPSGTFNITGFGTITVTENAQGTGIDWSSTFVILAVIVKGGPNANVYTYSPDGANSDTGLVTPTNPNNGNPFGLSHVSFCWDTPDRPPQATVNVSKTVTATYDERYTWTIDKSATPGTVHLFNGESQEVEYSVEVTKSGPTTENISVTGTITIENDGPGSVTVTGVTDTLDDGTAASVVCPDTVPFDIAEGASVQCTYSASPATTGADNNDVLVTFRDASLEESDPDREAQGTEPVAFTLGNTYDASICVDDNFDNTGDSEIFCADDTDEHTYTRTFSCDADEGSWSNTATIRETGASDSATVTVNCHELSISKTAETTFTRTFTWDITKSVTPEVIDMFVGDSHDVSYTVEVTKSAPVDSGWAVSGKITITNPAPKDAQLAGVIDTLPGGEDFQLSCEDPYPVVPANGTLECSYSATLPNPDERVNSARVVHQLYNYDAEGNGTEAETIDVGPAYAAVIFGDPTTVVNDEISVTDASDAAETSLGSTNASKTWTYGRTFTCGEDLTFNNTATIEETGQSASASVEVNCHTLSVTKTATTSFTRTWTWLIDKTGDKTAISLAPGGNFLVNYVVKVMASFVDSDHKVTGTISVSNSSPIDAVINSLADIVSEDIEATITCPPATEFPFDLLAGSTLLCTYSADLPDTEDRLNTATAVQQNYAYDFEGEATEAGTTNHSGTADVVFDEATAVTEIDECIDLADSKYGNLGTVCAEDLDEASEKTFNYSLTITTGGKKCTVFNYVNVASFETNDTETKGSDNHTVVVTVLCDDTAWAANAGPGTDRYNTRGNWATYITFPRNGNVYNIYAGQTKFAGTATLTENLDGSVTININLSGGFIFGGGDSLKVQGYNSKPSGNPSPGQFANKTSCGFGATTCSITVPKHPYYGIHLDVLSPPAP